MAKKIIVFGGTFNPIHNAHLRIARTLLKKFSPDKIIFIPANIPYHKLSCPPSVPLQRATAGDSQQYFAKAKLLHYTEVIDPKHRLAMTSLAIKGEPRFQVSDIEIKRGGNTFSIDTIKKLKKQYPKDTEFYFVIGTDSLIDFPRWHKVNELAELYRFITIARPGYPFAKLIKGLHFPTDVIKDIKLLYQPTPKLDISSTDIRQKIKAGKSIKPLVPKMVENYIKKQKLYLNISL